MEPEDQQHPDDMQPIDPLGYHRARYEHLKQIVTAMLNYYPFNMVVENYSYQALESEFNELADVLGLDDTNGVLTEMDERKQRDAQHPARWN